MSDQFFWVLHVMSLIDENSSMKASLSPVLEQTIEHAPCIYIMIPLPMIYLFSSTPYTWWRWMPSWSGVSWRQLIYLYHVLFVAIIYNDIVSKKWGEMALATQCVVDTLRVAGFCEMWNVVVVPKRTKFQSVDFFITHCNARAYYLVLCRRI
jgi:hypothetical protein